MVHVMMTDLGDRVREDGWSGFWKLLGAWEGQGGSEQLTIRPGMSYCQIAMILPERFRWFPGQHQGLLGEGKMLCEEPWSQGPRGPEFFSSPTRDLGPLPASRPLSVPHPY